MSQPRTNLTSLKIITKFCLNDLLVQSFVCFLLNHHDLPSFLTHRGKNPDVRFQVGVKYSAMIGKKAAMSQNGVLHKIRFKSLDGVNNMGEHIAIWMLSLFLIHYTELFKVGNYRLMKWSRWIREVCWRVWSIFQIYEAAGVGMMAEGYQCKTPFHLFFFNWFF